jgi:Fur family transcriptional regulator, ferric uptake regulator
MRVAQVQRTTRQRQIVLEELQRLTSHPTAAALYAIVRRRLPKISLGTVYRNLELLARMGLIKKLEFSCAETRFDAKIDHHDHLRCVCCGRVDDVSASPLELSGGEDSVYGGYQVLGHRLEFYGICPACRNESCGLGGNADAAMRMPNAEITPNRDKPTVLHHPK